MILGALLSFLFLFLLIRVAHDQLYGQYCGVLASFHTVHSYNSSAYSLPAMISVDLSFPEGMLQFHGTHSKIAELDITCFACVARVLDDANFTGVSFMGMNSLWTVRVWSNAEALAVFDKKSLSGSYNTACANEITTISLP